MKVVFAGLGEPLELLEGRCLTIEVANHTLFTRLILSIISGEGRYAQEPFTLWEGGSELSPKDTFFVIDNPLRVPWDDRKLIGKVVKKIEREFLEDEELRLSLEQLHRESESKIMMLGFGMNADYGLNQEWDIARYLKFLGFGVKYQEDLPLIDNLINFLSLTLDAGDKRVLMFVNLKTFLSKNDFESFLSYIFIHKMRIMMFECTHDTNCYEYEQKRLVDLHFIES